MPEDIIRKPRKITNPPICHKDFGEIGDNKNRIRLRVITYHHPMIGSSPPMFDLRQWLENKRNADGSIYTGWSSSGISLNENDLESLLAIIPEALELIQELKNKVE